MRRVLATASILALASSGAIALGPTGAGATPAHVAQAKKKTTQFALQTSGYGSRVRGGQVPAGSGTSAYQVIGCTNNAGITHENHEAEQQLPGVGVASQVTTKVWTRKKHGVVTSKSRNTISRIVLADSPLGSLRINAVKSVSKSFHDSSGFHAQTSSDIGSITFTDPTGTTTDMPIPTPGQPIDIPGLVTITVGNPHERSNADGARAINDVLIINSTATGSRARIAHTDARIHNGIKTGVFGGFASGSRATGLDGNTSSGRTPYQPMPCQGTDGKVRTNALASVNLGGQVVVSGLEAKQKGKQTNKRARGFEQGRVSRLNLGGGQLVVNGIVGRVHVERKGKHLNHLKRNTKGTRIGAITANGQEMEFPDTDTLEIPGVAVLERNVVNKIHSGISVIALRITLLDGTGAVIKLGQAQLRIRKSGR